ncbi:uncharacterized protein [Nicotiana tomentosiformis]|uniref:uncharacterized protein n=1 Tax=Nicotiana tomentosiformis TaxID=4098 RepID=UPI00388C6916
MGFSEHFINMVWNLMSNNWYSVLVNGKSSGFFKSTRGVKQGDPLSLALFILSTGVISRSLNKLFEDKSFVGFRMPKWSDPLNRLAYADDMIIFACSSSLFEQDYGSVGELRKDYYEDLIKKVKAKLYSWKGKLLSFGGKATLISSVLQSLQEVAELRKWEAWDEQLLDQTFNEEIAEHIRLNVHYEGSEGY